VLLQGVRITLSAAAGIGRSSTAPAFAWTRPTWTRRGATSTSFLATTAQASPSSPSHAGRHAGHRRATGAGAARRLSDWLLWPPSRCAGLAHEL